MGTLDRETQERSRPVLNLPVSRGIKSVEEYFLDTQPALSQVISIPCQDRGVCHA